MIPAANSSVAAAIRSSIFCCWLLEIRYGAGFLRRGTTGAGFGTLSDGRRCAALSAPNSDVFIRLLGPLAAIALAATGPNPSVGGTGLACPVVLDASSNRAFGRWGCSDFFRIGIHFLEAYHLLRLGKTFAAIKLRGLRKQIQAKRKKGL